MFTVPRAPRGETTGAQRQQARLAAKADRLRTFYARTPPPGPPSRQVKRRIDLKARKAAIAEAKRVQIKGRRKARKPATD